MATVNLHLVSTFNVRNAYWLALCSKIAYSSPQEASERFQDIGFDSVVGYNEFDDYVDTEYYLCSTDTFQVLVYRGSNNLADWLANFDYTKVPIKGLGDSAKVHAGFMREKGLATDILAGHIDKSKPLFITGHSKGACQALVEAVERTYRALPVLAVYAYAPSRVFNIAGSITYNYILGNKTHRFVNNNDTVCRLPPRYWNYRHVGQLAYINRHGSLVNPAPSPLFLGWDRLLGRFSKHGLTDGTRDHNIDSYVMSLYRSMVSGGW